MFDFQAPRAMCAVNFPPDSPYVATHESPGERLTSGYILLALTGRGESASVR
jgi:hypothetical protein